MAKRKDIFHPKAFEDYSAWPMTRMSDFKRLTELIKEISRTPFEGKGQPEPLKYELSGWWSRRITQEHRLVYRIDEQRNVEILACKGHYTAL